MVTVYDLVVKFSDHVRRGEEAKAWSRRGDCVFDFYRDPGAYAEMSDHPA